MTWFRVRSQGKTVYWSYEDHSSGLRLAVSANPDKWTWKVYDRDHPKTTQRTRRVGEGSAASVQGARRLAERWATDHTPVGAR